MIPHIHPYSPYIYISTDVPPGLTEIAWFGSPSPANRRVKTGEGQATLADIKKRRRDELEEAQEEGVSRCGDG